MRFLALILMLFTLPAAADPDRISILIGSHHIGVAPGQRFQGVNPGVFATWEGERLDWSLGIYRNSYNGVSVAGTVALPLIEREHWSLAAFAGVALYPGVGRRFAVHAGDFVPIGGLQLTAGPVFAQLIPSDGKAVDSILAFGLTFPAR